MSAQSHYHSNKVALQVCGVALAIILLIAWL